MVGIYKITSPSGKVYIGQSLDIENRWKGYNDSRCKGQTRIYNSIQKYGIENHTFETIEECLLEDLNRRERYWQDHYDVLGGNGLNCILTETDEKPRVRITKQVTQFTKKGIFIKVWPSLKECSESLGIAIESISQCARGLRYHSAGGYVFRYGEITEDLYNFKIEKKRFTRKNEEGKILQLDIEGNKIRNWISSGFAAKVLKLEEDEIKNAFRSGSVYAGFKWRLHRKEGVKKEKIEMFKHFKNDFEIFL